MAGLLNIEPIIARSRFSRPPSRTNEVAVDMAVARLRIVAAEIQERRHRELVGIAKAPLRHTPRCAVITRNRQLTFTQMWIRLMRHPHVKNAADREHSIALALELPDSRN